MYYVYILRCDDNSLYTGITTDIARRFSEHKSKNYKGAKYTKSHGAVSVEALWECESKIVASKLEYRIKKNMNKSQKEDLILGKINIYDFFEELKNSKIERIQPERIIVSDIKIDK